MLDHFRTTGVGWFFWGVVEAFATRSRRTPAAEVVPLAKEDSFSILGWAEENLDSSGGVASPSTAWVVWEF